jgi:hypothetical protein
MMNYQVFYARYALWKKTILSENCRGNLSPRRLGFDPRSVYLRLVVGKLALENIYLCVFLIFPVSINPTVFHTHVHIHIALTRRATGEAYEPWKQQFSFGNWRMDRKLLSLQREN